MKAKQANSPDKPERRTRLSVRIPVFVLLFSVIIAAGASIIQLFIEYKKESDLIQSRMKQIELSVTGVLAVSIWKLDEEQIKLQLNNILQIPDMRYIKVESPDLGDIIAGEQPTGDIMSQTYPLTYGESGGEQVQVGNLHVTASLEGLYTRLQDRALLIMLTEAIKTFLVSIFILMLIHFLVTRHLTRMARYVRDLNISKLDEELKLTSRGEHHRVDELDELVSAINTMLTDLKNTHSELQKSHITLENKVALRTKELVLAKEKAEEASQAKSEFLATINHELRTPLTSILGGLGLITKGVRGEVPEKMASPIDIAYRNSKRLLLLVNDVLDIAKIEAGHLTLKYSEINLYDFLKQAVMLNQAYAETFDVEVTLIACPEDLTMYADENRLQQVMNNLISNAIKFTRPGDAVEITAKQLDDFVEISVTDHGHGIPDNLKKNIFEKFTQADSSDTRTTGGTGLGLAISKSIVELHNGSINFKSVIDEGTTFYITVPVKK